MAEYYEEKFHEGDYWYRRSPRDLWYKFNYEMLLAKTVELESELETLYYNESMRDLYV
jgi:hypothetical protein